MNVGYKDTKDIRNKHGGPCSFTSLYSSIFKILFYIQNIYGTHYEQNI